jgi:hypothetical protein
MKGWDNKNEKELLPYFNRRNELTISQGMVRQNLCEFFSMAPTAIPMDVMVLYSDSDDVVDIRYNFLQVPLHPSLYLATKHNFWRVISFLPRLGVQNVTSPTGAMEKNSHRFCRTIHGSHVFDSCGRSFEMARSYTDDENYCN